MLDSFLRDLRVALRVLRKDKSFCFLSVLILGLGIGAATTQFAVVNAVVLRGVSLPHPEQLMSVGLIDPRATGANNNSVGTIPTYQDYEDLRAAQQSFVQMAAYEYGSTINLTYKNNPQRCTGAYVTDEFFKILGVSPILGRDFTAEDNKPGVEKVAILSHEIWQRDFSGDRSVIGQSVTINGKPATVIGVMPRNFKFPLSEELWVPLYNEYAPRPRGILPPGAFSRGVTGADPSVMGRLKPDVNLDQVNAEFVGLARRLAQENPKSNGTLVSASVQPLVNVLTGPQLRQTVWAMLVAVILVLLISCVNVMNMQLGRSVLRAKEVAIRGALGATRWRIVQQILIESAVVAVLGAITGILIAGWAIALLSRETSVLPFPLPYWAQFKIDTPVLVFTVSVTLVATIVSGLVPAWISAQGNAAEIMKEAGRANSSRITNLATRILVVAQIALTAALLIAATLQIKSIRNQLTLNYGYDEKSVYSARIGLMEGAYPKPEAKREFFLKAVRSLRANSAFDNAAMTDRWQMTFAGFAQYEVDGGNYIENRDRPRGNFESVSDNYFSTLGLKILEGRDFTTEDLDSKQPVAIVNTSFARKYWGNQSALGHQVRVFNPGEAQSWRTIVGVVPDTLMQGPLNQQTDGAGFYVPLLGLDLPPQFSTIIVRPRMGERADTVGPALRKAVAQLDPNLPIYFAGTAAQLHNDILGFNRLIAALFTIFGVVAFLLSAVGLYGVMSFAVNQRTQEFGIRMALGADTARIFRMVMTQGAWQLAAGLALGASSAALFLGVLGAAVVQNILFKVNALEPSIYLIVAALLTAVAAVSCFVPARRATRVDPMVALRYE
jgi:predicted permease